VAGPPGALFGSVGALVSGYGWLLGFAMMTPRILFAMGERSELPLVLARIHAAYRTPHVAIVLNSAAALALSLLGSFAWAANLSVLTRLGIFALTCAALPVLRRSHPDDTPPFRLRGGTAVAVAGILFCGGLLATRSLAELWPLAAILAAGLVVRWLTSRNWETPSVPDP
jgi:APA family basic amino acid/polyamine antiporter